MGTQTHVKRIMSEMQIFENWENFKCIYKVL